MKARCLQLISRVVNTYSLFSSDKNIAILVLQNSDDIMERVPHFVCCRIDYNKMVGAVETIVGREDMTTVMKIHLACRYQLTGAIRLYHIHITPINLNVELMLVGWYVYEQSTAIKAKINVENRLII